LTQALRETAPPYAIVVVNVSLQRRVTAATSADELGQEERFLGRAFHYSIPSDIASQIKLGHLCWVPFGPRVLQGLVVGFDTQSPVDETRAILRIADPQPIVSPVHIHLARWISDHYLAPIDRCFWAMLPPGVLQNVDTLLRPVVAKVPSEATPAQQEILGLILKRGQLSLQQIRRATKLKSWRTIVNRLVDLGWATKESAVRAPSVRPRLARVVRSAPDAEARISDVSRAPKQRLALEYLIERRRDASDWIPASQVTSETGASVSSLDGLAAKGLIETAMRRVWRDPLQGREFVATVPPVLTPEQDQAWAQIRQDLLSAEGHAFLLQGVTGSGKTEVYLRAVQETLRRGKGAIVLVPEISLTPQTIRRFGARFPSTIAVMHSRLSAGERYDQWQRIRAGELRLVVGSRSAIFAPVQDLGLIVLDEEHEWSYKQGNAPRYHARSVALQLCKLAGATVILGSATPDLETAYLAERGEIVRLALPKRVLGHRRLVESVGQQNPRYRPAEASGGDALYAELPPVRVVDMRAELRAGNTSILSRSLRQAMDVALAAHEQVILFLNRRGAASFVMCRDCGHVIKCPHCDVPLTYHSAVDDLICHHCNYAEFVPQQCPSCWSGRIRYFGIGTQRVESYVKEVYPGISVIRWDADTTGGKRSHEEILDAFVTGQADVMVGTQMIAKGLDLPHVTLVGVITADTMINLPDYRASERTFQLLTQVAGRAGRSILGGKVIIQTYTPDHPAITAASRHDYASFYTREIAFRREHWYPPLSRLVKLVFMDTNPSRAEREAERLHRALTVKIARLGLADVDLIGPAPAFFSRIRGKTRWQILIRGANPASLVRDMRLPLGWRIDVDPVSVL